MICSLMLIVQMIIGLVISLQEQTPKVRLEKHRQSSMPQAKFMRWKSLMACLLIKKSIRPFQPNILCLTVLVFISTMMPSQVQGSNTLLTTIIWGCTIQWKWTARFTQKRFKIWSYHNSPLFRVLTGNGVRDSTGPILTVQWVNTQ
jgi:hypothetical protein